VFVGIHSASGSERQWDYFAEVLGGRFVVHPVLQTFVIQVADLDSVLMRDIPPKFDWTDECYFLDHLSPDLHVLLTADRTSLHGLEQFHVDVSRFPNPLPLAWFHTFDGGREFYLAIGHREEAYRDLIFLNILSRGILWAMGR
jgi:type 1 glutamine amidotransferase